MARVERGNVVLHVEDYEVDRYINMGYNLTDDAGNILRECIPSDIGVLQRFYLEHIQRISELESELAKVTAESTSKKPRKKATESEDK